MSAWEAGASILPAILHVGRWYDIVLLLLVGKAKYVFNKDADAKMS